MVLVDIDELAALGYTVVRNFLSPPECAEVREAMDGQFGAEPTEQVPHELIGHPSQTHSRNFVHGICHPNPAMASLVGAMPKMVQAHCQVLRSKLPHIKLNGQSLVRTDPYEGDGDVNPGGTNPTNIHVSRRSHAANRRYLVEHACLTLGGLHVRRLTTPSCQSMIWPPLARCIRARLSTSTTSPREGRRSSSGPGRIKQPPMLSNNLFLKTATTRTMAFAGGMRWSPL